MRLGVEAALIDGHLVSGDVEILGGRVAGVGLASPNGRGIAVPGFVDLQVNGFSGVDFLTADADGYRRGGEALLETGVTAYLPTFISAPEEDLLAALGNVPTHPGGPRLLGVHLEGPFLSEKRLGIHPPAARRDPDPALLERLLGGSEIEVRGGVARGLDDVLAGSALTMIEAIRNLHELGVPLPEAVAAATEVPARVLGLSTLGRIGPDVAADLVVLDDNLEIDRVCVGGEARVVA